MAATVEIILRAVDEVSGKIEQIEQKFQGFRKVGDVLQKTGLAMAGLGTAIGAPLVMAVKTFSDFEQAMKNVQVVMGGTEEDFKKLSEAAKEIGRTTKFSATEAAEGLYSLASAGLKTSDAIKVLKDVTNLAAATQSNFAQTSQAIVATLSQFSLSTDEASRVADVFTAAIGNSMATLDKLQYSMKYVGTIAGSLGLSLEEVTSALMVMYNAGLQGEQAGTALRSMLNTLINPSKSAATALEALGISMEEINPSAHSLTEIIARLQEAGVTASKAMQIFGQEAGPAVAALLSAGSSAVEKYTQTLQKSVGASQKAAEEQMNTVQGMMLRLKSAFESLMIDIGQSLVPVVEKIVGVVQKMINAWNKVPAPIRDVITQFSAISAIVLVVGGGISALIGTILKMVTIWKEFGTVISSTIPIIKNLSTLFAGLGPAISKVFTTIVSMAKGMMSTLSTIFAATGPWGLVIAAIVGAVMIIIKYWEPIKEFFIKLFNAIGSFFSGWISWFKKTWQAAGDFFKSAWEGIKSFFIKASVNMQKAFSNYTKFLIAYWKSMGDIFIKVWDKVKTFFIKAWELMKSAFDKVVKFFREIWQGLVKYWTGLITTFRDFFVSIWNKIKDFFKKIWDTMKKVAEIALNALLAPINLIIKGLNKIIDLLNKIPGVNLGHIRELKVDFTGTEASIQTVAESVENLNKSIGRMPIKHVVEFKSKLSSIPQTAQGLSMITRNIEEVSRTFEMAVTSTQKFNQAIPTRTPSSNVLNVGILVGNVPMLKEVSSLNNTFQELTESTKTLAENYAEQAQSFSDSINLMKESIKALEETIDGLIDKFSKWKKEQIQIEDIVDIKGAKKAYTDFVETIDEGSKTLNKLAMDVKTRMADIAYNVKSLISDFAQAGKKLVDTAKNIYSTIRDQLFKTETELVNLNNSLKSLDGTLITIRVRIQYETAGKAPMNVRNLINSAITG